ncbi:MAG: hypothetical protein H6730_25925 [Deltaproteobacteria bacterium]|nr:hypothetical protein [Deltaproteobacteria bacterium]
MSIPVDHALREAGLRPPVLRAFAAAGLAWVAVLLLPVRLDSGGPVWAWDLMGGPSGDLAVAGAAFAALALLLLSRTAPGRPMASVALMGLTATSVGLAATLSDPDAQAALLPALPSALGRGYVALVVALAAAGLGLEARRARAAALAFGLSAVALTFLYLWPHPYGTLSEAALDSARAALAPAAAPDRGGRAAWVTHTALALLPAALVSVGALMRAVAGPENRRVMTAWILAATPATLVALSVKAAAQLGSDALVLVGLRAGLLLVALLLVTTFAGRALAEEPPAQHSLRFRFAGHGLTSAALVVALVPHVDQAEPAPWAMGAAPRWATELYTSALPRVAIAAQEVDLPGGDAALAAAVGRAVGLAAPAPAVAEVVEELGRLSPSPGQHRRALERLGERLNEAARQASLPFYVDLQVYGLPRDGAAPDWLLALKTYRIEEAHRFLASGQLRSTLWLRRLDRTNLTDARLGWTRHDAPEGVVMLDVIRDHWEQDLAPALGGVASAKSRRTRTYARHARALTEDLAHAVAGRVEPGDVEALLACMARGGRGTRRRAPARCQQLEETVEPEILQALAHKVEVHELRHAMDGLQLRPPRALLDAMPGFSEQSVSFAAAELSAYLTEVAASPVPRVALAHFLALAEAHPRSPEGFAGRLAAEALREGSGLDPHQLLETDGDEVATAAAYAYERLFGRPVVLPVRLDEPGPGAAEHAPGAV